jgi:hypothetical protein
MTGHRTRESQRELRRRHLSTLLATMNHPSVRRLSDALANLDPPIIASKSTVQRDIDHCKAEWKAARLADMDVVIGQELARLQIAEEQLWIAARRSGRAVTVTNVRSREVLVRVPGEDGTLRDEVRTLTNTYTQQLEREPDPRFYRGLIDVFERRAKLLGLDQPTIQPVIGDFTVHSDMSAEEATARMRDLMQRARLRIAAESSATDDTDDGS